MSNSLFALYQLQLSRVLWPVLFLLFVRSKQIAQRNFSITVQIK